MDVQEAILRAELVLVAHVTWCCDGDCQFSDHTHLVISTSYAPLETGNAVAISYTWGEFDRHEVSLGHDPDGRQISIVLGCEWDEADYINKLADMAHSLSPSATATPFWVDQLCIPQDNDAVIRATLAAIPQIFYTFEAVTLLPGILASA
jgi:hypothetical protein